MGRDVGRMGEGLLRNWAAQAGIVLNDSDDQDATGWDFFLEWPQTSSDTTDTLTLPFDRRTAPLQCLVQLKATDGRRGRRQVKLSNWQRFVQSALPAFFLVLEFDGRNDCQRAYLVHVGEEYIRGTLERLRRIAATEPSTKLHQRTMDFRWGEQERLPSLDGHGLEQAIRARVGSSMESYTKRKLSLVDSVGYEDGGRRLNVQYRLPADRSRDPQDLLVDFALGLVPHLEITGGELLDVRFGIPAPEPEEILPPGARLEIMDRKSAGRGRVKLRAPAANRELTLSAETYLPQGFAHILEESKLRGRFAVPFVDFVFGFGTVHTVNLKLRLPDSAEEHPLADLQPAADLILLLDTAQRADAEIEIEMRFEGHPLGKGRFTKAASPVQPLVEWASLVRHAWTVARFFGFDQQVRVRLSELVRYRDPLLFLHTLLGPDRAHVRVDFWLDRIPAEPEMPWCIPIAAEARVGEHHVQIAVAAVGQAAPTGQIDGTRMQFQLVTSDVRRHRQHDYITSETPAYSAEELRRSVGEEYEPTMNVVLIGD